MDHTNVGTVPWDLLAGLAITVVSSLSAIVIAYFKYAIQKLKIQTRQADQLDAGEDDDS